MNNVAFIIPTGIGCAIGGHAGDATPAAKLIAQVCDKLILHPNVVNASDINEMPENALYVEGSILDLFLEDKINLKEVRANNILVAVNSPAQAETINAINASRVTLGINVEIMYLEVPLKMFGWGRDGVAGGTSAGVSELIDQAKKYNTFDALAIATPIDVEEGQALDYLRSSGTEINPWGGVEAQVSRQIASALQKPVAHAPVENHATKNNPELFNLVYNQVVMDQKAPEVISSCYLHCVLKGLHKAPRMVMAGYGITRDSLICLVTPAGCIGRPHVACFDAGIPVIAVEENTTAFNDRDDRIIYVANYLEAAGMIACMNAGVSPSAVMAQAR